jgi:uncharacterized protein (DUF58 family)
MTMRSPWRHLRDYASVRARRWALGRQGRDPPQLTLASPRIYILPTAAGLVYAAMLVTMLAGAMNYNNNLAFALTFLLAGVGIVTIYHTHRTLTGLRLHYLGAEAVFAGDPLLVRVRLLNDATEPRAEVFLDWAGGAGIAGGLGPLQSRTVTMPLATFRRGPLPLPALRVATRAPLGLMRAWAWVHLDSLPIVYPRPAPAGAPSTSPDTLDAPDGLDQRGDDDFAGLRSYQPGDSPRHIAWKSYARTGQLLVREYRGGSTADTVWIDWDAVSGDPETRIAQLTRLVVDAFARRGRWGLRLPGLQLEPGQGREHLHDSLRSLALHGLPPGGR